jgi:hypothetical protein
MPKVISRKFIKTVKTRFDETLGFVKAFFYPCHGEQSYYNNESFMLFFLGLKKFSTHGKK